MKKLLFIRIATIALIVSGIAAHFANAYYRAEVVSRVKASASADPAVRASVSEPEVRLLDRRAVLAAELRNYLLGAGLIFGAFWFRASVNARRPAGMLPPVS